MVLDTYSFAFSQIKNAQNLNGKNSQLSYLKKPQILSNHGTGIMSSDGPGEEEASMLKKLTVVTTSKGKDMMEDINNYRYTFNSAGTKNDRWRCAVRTCIARIRTCRTTKLLLESEIKRVLVSNAGGQDMTSNTGRKKTLWTCTSRCQILFVNIRLCRRTSTSVSWHTRL